MRTFWFHALALAALAVSTPALQAAPRTWTDLDGRTVEADLIRTDATAIVIRRASDGREFTLARDRLSPADLAFLAAPPPHGSAAFQPASENLPDPTAPAL